MTVIFSNNICPSEQTTYRVLSHTYNPAKENCYAWLHSYDRNGVWTFSLQLQCSLRVHNGYCQEVISKKHITSDLDYVFYHNILGKQEHCESAHNITMKTIYVAITKTIHDTKYRRKFRHIKQSYMIVYTSLTFNPSF